MGLIDSFRELHPNVTEVPGGKQDSLHDPTTQFTTSCSVISQAGVSGCTWSTVNKFLPDWEFNIPEPQDRIDFILYKGIFFKELPCDVIFKRSC